MKRSMFFMCMLLLFGACNGVPPEREPTSMSGSSALPKPIVDFASQLEKDAVEDEVASISAVVFKGTTLLWSGAYGFADRNRRIEADSNFIYRTGSISKSMTAVLMMQLKEAGILKLSDPVELYLPEVKNLKGYREHVPITLRQLASHTSGLIREPQLSNAAYGPIENWEDKVIESISHTSFLTSPGQRYSYSNIGYGILGLAISRAARRPFMELMQEKIFDPLGMTSSCFIVPDRDQSRLATGYAGGATGFDAEHPAQEHRGRGYKVPNGGVYATPNDLARFAAGLLGLSPTPILTRESREQITTIVTPEDPHDGYGLGFRIVQNDELYIVSHGGSVAGYTAILAMDKESGLGAAIMRNYNDGITNLGLRASFVVRDLKRKDQ